MATPSRSRIRTEGRRRTRDELRRFGESVRQHRLDAGISQARVAAASAISPAHLSTIEAGTARPSIEVCARVAAAIGGELSVRFFPGAGPILRDHLQSAMIETLLQAVHRRWRRRLEVPVLQPVRGYIDLVLEDPRTEVTVAVEVHSQLRRFEQQLRWAQGKAAGLGEPSEGRPSTRSTISQLLVLRSTELTRRLVATYPEVFATAFPTPISATIAALTTLDAPWPGSSLLWMRVERGVATLLDRPPRGILVGR